MIDGTPEWRTCSLLILYCAAVSKKESKDKFITSMTIFCFFTMNTMPL